MSLLRTLAKIISKHRKNTLAMQQPLDDEPNSTQAYFNPTSKSVEIKGDFNSNKSVVVIDSNGVSIVSTYTYNTIVEFSWGTLICVLGCLGAMIALFMVWAKRISALDKERTGWDYLTSGSDSLLKISILLFSACSLLNLWLAVSNFKGLTSRKYAFSLSVLAVIGLIIAHFVITDSKSRTLVTSNFKLEFGYFFSVVTLVIQIIGIASQFLRRKSV